MATMSDLVLNDSLDYVIPEGAQTSEREAADMLTAYIEKCLDERVILDDGSRR
jgi:hypothetical protein